MNAFNNINLAGSCVLTSTEYAKEIGIPESKWVYPLGGAGSSDATECMYPSRLTVLADERSLATTEFPFESGYLNVTRRGSASLGCNERRD